MKNLIDYRRFLILSTIILAVGAVFSPSIIQAQNQRVSDDVFENPVLSDEAEEMRAVASEHYVVTPAKKEFNEDLLGHLNVPEGFAVSVFAEGLGNARIIAVNNDGHIYVSQQEQGAVSLLRDSNSDGKADDVSEVV